MIDLFSNELSKRTYQSDVYFLIILKQKSNDFQTQEEYIIVIKK